ncbi:hypothetical protein E3N88_20057 [Mikania micrantha]|uniref:Uncharacterized protein n=1 Tax=Mikania micrantha TaxID=192012 RepID=A0A5N6NGE1_9ASTR|nr:hypothetical protein E3N88_20057 [Mikania micrantha]
MLTGGHNERNFDVNAGSAMTCGGKRKQSSFGSFYMTMSCDCHTPTPRHLTYSLTSLNRLRKHSGDVSEVPNIHTRGDAILPANGLSANSTINGSCSAAHGFTRYSSRMRTFDTVIVVTNGKIP